MVKTEVILCDTCKKALKFSNCEICGADLCGDCIKQTQFRFIALPLFEVIFCKKCHTKAYERLEKEASPTTISISSKVKTEMIILLKKNIMLENLNGNN